MSELENVVKDVRTGALPLRELPGFVLWLIARTFWLWIALLVVGLLVVMAFPG